MEAKPQAAPRVRGPARPFPLSPYQVRALDALDRYRLMTAAQGVRIGLGSSEQGVLALLRPLVTARLVAHSSDALVSGVTRLPRMHYLTPKGATALAAAIGAPVTGARRRFGETSEVLHRRGIVDFHIALQTWAASSSVYEVETFVPEFEPGLSGRRKATVLPPKPGLPKYPADALARISGTDGIARALFFELERGGARGDLHRFRKKLPLLRELAGGLPRSGQDQDRRDGYLEDVLDTPGSAVRVVIVFKDEKMRDAALKWWPDKSSADWGAFFIKAASDLADDFNAGWWQPDGTRRALFQVSSLTGSSTDETLSP